LLNLPILSKVPEHRQGYLCPPRRYYILLCFSEKMRVLLLVLLLASCASGAELARYVPSAEGVLTALVDVSGNGNHAIGSMDIAEDGGKLFFTPNEGIVLPSRSLFPPILASQAFTLCTWIRNWPQSGNNLFRFHQYSQTTSLFKMMAGAHFVFTDGLLYFDSWERVTVAGLPQGSAKNTWMHVCLAADYSARTHEVFVDGVSKAVVDWYTKSRVIDPVTGAEMYVQMFLTTQAWDSGDLSDVRLFDSALTQSEVNTVMSDAPTLLVADAVCPSGWFAGATLCYQRFDQLLEYTAANAFCNAIGGVLARVPTMADLRVLQGQYVANGWVGTRVGARCQANDHFDCTWVNGDAVRDMAAKYATGEPGADPTAVDIGIAADGLFDSGTQARSFLCSIARLHDATVQSDDRLVSASATSMRQWCAYHDEF